LLRSRFLIAAYSLPGSSYANNPYQMFVLCGVCSDCLSLSLLLQLGLISALASCIHSCIQYVILTQTALPISYWHPIWKAWSSRC